MATWDLVLTMGQSNMSGVGNGNQAPVTDPALCLEWDGGPGVVQVDDPTSCTTSPYKAQTGSALPSFSNRYVSWSGRPLVVVRAAAGGTALLASNTAGNANGDWSPTGTRFPAAVARFLDAIADVQALGHTVGRTFALWSQGHKDALTGNDLDDYEAATAALVTRLRADLSLPTIKIYMELLSSTAANSSTPPTEPNWQTVRDAQLAACASTDGLEMAFQEGIDFYNRGYIKFDNVHYNQDGLNYFGTTIADFVATDQGLTDPGPPPEPLPVPASLAGRLLLAGG